jgi:hypothetical protein
MNFCSVVCLQGPKPHVNPQTALTRDHKLLYHVLIVSGLPIIGWPPT